MPTVSFSIQLFRGKTLRDGTHPIVVLTTHRRTVRRIYLPKLRVDDPSPAVSSEDWDDEDRRVLRGHKDRKRINEIIQHFEGRGRAIIDKQAALGQPFDHTRFKDELLLSDDQRRAREQSKTDVFAMFDTIIVEMQRDGRIGTATAYKDAKSALRLYYCGGDRERAKTNTGTLPFSEVASIQKVKGWATFMLSRGNSPASAGMRLRQLRAVLNRARAERLITFDDVPFRNTWNPGGLRVSDYRGDLSPQPLSEEEVSHLLNHPGTEPRTRWALDVFRLLMAMGGPHMHDVANLTRENLRAGRIHYRRSKTKRSQRASVEVSIAVTPVMKEILDRYQPLGSNFLLPIIGAQHRTPTQQKDAIKQCIRIINDRLNQVAQELGIERKVTTNVSRDTAATILKNLGIAPDVINELQGRANSGMLNHYAPVHRHEVIDNAQRLLWERSVGRPVKLQVV